MNGDEAELIDIANFIRARFNIKVKIDLYVFFNEDGTVKRFSKHVHTDEAKDDYRCPDLTLVVNNKILCFIEIDGSIHDVHVDDTDKRNQKYKKSGLDLIVANKAELKLMNINMFEFLESEISKRLNSLTCK